MAVKKLRKIQLGLEATKGTAVPATTIWRGNGTIDDQRTVVWPEEDVGYLCGLDRQYTSAYLAALAMEDTPATFEQLPYILSASIEDVVSGAADGAGSGKIYDYDISTTSANATKAYTIEGGDDQQEEEMEYSFVESFKLSGKAGEAWMVGAEWKGRQVAPSTYTGALSAPTVEEMLFSKTKLYIDAIGGTIGSTQKTQTLLAADLGYTSGLKAVPTGDGNLYFTFTKMTPPEALLNITFEHDATSVAEKAIWRAGTARLLRLKCEGSALTTPGTAYTYKTMIVDLVGKWEKFDKIGEQDQNDIVTGVFRGRFNATPAICGQIIVVNELASLP